MISQERKPAGSELNPLLSHYETGSADSGDLPPTQAKQPPKLTDKPDAAKTTLLESETELLPGNGDGSPQDSTVKLLSDGPINSVETRLLAEQETRLLSDSDTYSNLTGDSLPDGNKAKYEFVSEIAHGGMGRIVVMRDRSLRRKVAMKLLISPKGRGVRQQVNRLLAEAQTTGQLEHPNIVPIHDVGINQDNKYYFTMKLVKGSTLKGVFRTLAKEEGAPAGQYSLARLLAIFQQIANGLGFAHSRGVIHRDLKPENIMIGEFGEVLIMDWGIAKLIQPTADTNPAGALDRNSFADQFDSIDTQEKDGTAVGTVAGTPGYMSPEQARGEVDKLDARTDIFSLGAMLYEMLAGSAPYNQATAKERLRAAANEEPIEKPSVRFRKTHANQVTKIPREVAAISMKAVAPKPADRYQSAQDFFDDIQRYLEGRSVNASADTPVQQATKWMKRNRVMVRFIAAIVCAVVLAVFGARFLIRRSAVAEYMDEGQKVVAAAEAKREKQVQVVSELTPANDSYADVNNDSYADVNRQRGLDSIDEEYSAQLTQAADYYSRVFEYEPRNSRALAALAKIYMELWHTAQRRNKPELMTAYAHEIERYAGPADYRALYKSEIDGDGKFKLIAGGVTADVFIFRYVETGKWNRLTPAPYRFAERKIDDAASTEAAAKLGQAVDGHDGSSVYFLNMDSKYGHRLGQTPLKIDQMPIGSYLLVLRAPGYEDLHLPVTIPRQQELELNVRMLKTGERPAGFSYVPSVFAKVGGPAAGTRWPNYAWKPVNPFFIQTYEVTFGEYEEFLKGLIAEGRLAEAQKRLPRDFGFDYLQIAGKQIIPHPSLTEGWRKWPVRGVSWLDAQIYAQWRSQRDGVSYRLPAELEWEVAARGTDGRRYTWGELFWPQAAHLSQGYGSRQNTNWNIQLYADESVFGVWDMTGSQAEWCADDFENRSGEHVLRGNAWALQPIGLETAFRTSGAPDYFHATTGFRLATNLK